MAVYKIGGCQWNCYPDTTVLINKLDIRNQAELDAVEKQITLLRGTQAAQGDLTMLRVILEDIIE